MKEDFNFKILTTDTDLGESSPYKGVIPSGWTKREDASEVYYLSKSNLSKEKIAEVINATPHDLVYLNSFYSKWFSIVPLQLKKKGIITSPVVLAPRGMLSEGALALKKFKKRSFIQLSKITGLHKQITWHATYEKEIEEIRNVFGKDAKIKLCPNFSKPIKTSAEIRQKTSGNLKLFFLSRISRVKNLHIALKALQNLSADLTFAPGESIIYDIYGALEDGNYKEECLEIINKLPAGIKAEFKDELNNDRVGEIISGYHFLFLPTSNENFGHSIFEALQAGCPVIISNKTPWKNLEMLNCGWDVEPLAENYVSILKKCYQMEDTEYQAMYKAALTLAEGKLTVPGHREAAIELFG